MPKTITKATNEKKERDEEDLRDLKELSMTSFDEDFVIEVKDQSLVSKEIKSV